MSTPEESAPSDGGYHWTTRKAEIFLGALAHLGRVGEAARVVGMSRQSAYSLRARLGRDALLARLWDKAQAEGRDRRRARAKAARTAKATKLAPEDDIFGLGR